MVKTAKQGDKITEESCPGCHDEVTVEMDNGAEVFECDNCEFKVKKKKNGRRRK